MSLLRNVLDGARSGHSPGRMSRELGVDVGLIDGALDHWQRLGLVSTGGDALGSPCAACPDTETQAIACAGCFFSGVR